MTTEAPILTETAGRVGVITLNRPQQLNALNDALMDALGEAKAMDMCLSARTLDAAEADRCGLVSRVVPLERLHDEALALATRIAGFSLPALMAIKESVNRAHEGSLSEGMGFERRQLHARFASEDAHEGMKAFLEKRPPVFGHR